MKKIVLGFCFSIFVLSVVIAQNPGEWVWIHGSNIPNATAVFGTKGIPAPANVPRCAYEPCEWTDLNGNFWLFGGGASGCDNSDLWKYDPKINQWAWVNGPGTCINSGVYGIQGVPSAGNYPPSKIRGVATWTDLNGYLWLFGGNISGGSQSDLWRYNITSNEWTWMKGPKITNQPGSYGIQGIPDTANYPPSRCECAGTWVDNSGDLWLFGGIPSISTGCFNDMWRYKIATNTWTWMKGSNSTGAAGTYGTRGVENAANTPGGRMSYCKWKDRSGNFWFFGGGDFNTSTHFNDLWRFNPATNNWTWINGSNVSNSSGNYGVKCILSPSNAPPARFENRVAWIASNGDLWMFGGASGGSSLPSKYNDLWKYCMADNAWAWVSGSSSFNAAGNWGTMGVSSPSNVPSARGGSVSWFRTDSAGNDLLYLFGGYNLYNDLWVYKINPTCGPCTSCKTTANFYSTDSAFCNEPVSCISFTDNSTCSPTSWHWLFPGAFPDTSTRQNPTGICYYTPGTYPVTLIVSNASGSDTLIVSPMITVGGTPASPVIAAIGDTLFCSHASSYQWYFNGNIIAGATDSFYVATQWGIYAVGITDSIGCSRLSDGITLDPTSVLSPKERSSTLYPNPVEDLLVISHLPLGGRATIEIYSMLGEKVFSEQLQNNSKQETVNCKQFSAGMYFVIVADTEKRFTGKFVKE